MNTRTCASLMDHQYVTDAFVYRKFSFPQFQDFSKSFCECLMRLDSENLKGEDVFFLNRIISLHDLSLSRCQLVPIAWIPDYRLAWLLELLRSALQDALLGKLVDWFPEQMQADSVIEMTQEIFDLNSGEKLE